MAGGRGTWFVPRTPKIKVDVAAGCPRSVTMAQDVVNTFRGPPLVPAGPSGGLICRYQGPPHRGRLGRQTRLAAAGAKRLAAKVRALDLKAPGPALCPDDIGSFAMIGFSYPARPDVGLWYWTSGCQILDNGRIGAGETANPSFYVGFLQEVNKLSPPLPSRPPG